MTCVTQGSPLLSLAWQPPPPHFDLLRLDRSLDTFPRQTPGCAESKSHFHLELCLSCALRRSRSPLLPKGSCEQTPPKNRIHWNQALGQAAASNGPTGRGGRHLLGTSETCVRCPLPWSFSRRLCSDLAARVQGPQQRPRPREFFRTATSHAFQRPEVFTCHRCVKRSKSSLTPRTCTKSQLLCEALMTQ